MGLDENHACPLKRIKWTHLSVPWSCTHITLGEADAATWAAEDRLRRAVDDGARFIHPLDSAATVGSFTKGRSSSHALNHRCRRLASCTLAGGHEVFHPWVPSGDNPADMPSRRNETKSKTQVTEELPASEPPLSLLHVGQQLDDAFYFIHSCSGPRRPGDVLDCIERSSAEIGINIVGIAIDPLAAVSLPEMGHVSHADLLSPHWLDWLVHLIHSGRVLGGMGSPPCSTISAARHVPMKGRDGSSRHRRRGPRPLRSRSDPWVPVPYCDHKDVHAVNIGSPFLLVLGLLGEICNYGGWSALEHPADRQREPYASFFATIEVQFFFQTVWMAIRGYSPVHVWGIVQKAHRTSASKHVSLFWEVVHPCSKTSMALGS